MTKTLFTVAQASQLIAAGKAVLVAGDQALLRQLPKGRWIGGTIPYFMTEGGGVETHEQLLVTELPEYAAEISTRFYGERELLRLPADAPAHGMSFIIVPANSPAHLAFAQHAPDYPGLFNSPLIGWNAGVALEQLGKVAPLVFDGRTGESSSTEAVVLHASVPANKLVNIEIANIFVPGDGAELRFEKTGFSVQDVLVDGERVNFAAWLEQQSVDTRLPLVADYSGAMINTSFQRIDAASGTVHLYAPVFEGVTYKIARPVGDYRSELTRLLGGSEEAPLFCCNCILNYLYGELEGRTTGVFTGPITFGEIAYQQLNQTLAYLRVRDA